MIMVNDQEPCKSFPHDICSLNSTEHCDSKAILSYLQTEYLGLVHRPEKFENRIFPLKMDQITLSIHTSPEKFENIVFTLKTRQMFSVNTMSEKFENASHQLFWFCV